MSGIDTSVTPVAPSVLTPPAGSIAFLNGNEVIAFDTTGTHVYWLRNFITLTRPTSREITPGDLGSFTVTAVAVSPFVTKTAIPAYLLANDGSFSAVWYTPNAAAVAPVWTKGANIAGVYTSIRPTKTAGTILIYGIGASSSFNQTYDFTTGQHGWTPSNLGVSTTIYTPGVGFVGTGSDGSNDNIFANASLSIAAAISTAAVTLSASGYLVGDTALFAVAAWNDVIGSDGIVFTSAAPPSATINLSPGATVGELFIRAQSSPLDTTPETGSVTLSKVVITGTSAASPEVVKSTDFGATWGTVQTFGSSPSSVGGFDVQRAGTVSYGGAAGAVYKATTLGGSYSSFASATGKNVVACIMPYYRRNTNTLITSASDPDVIIALDGNDSDGASLYWLSGVTAVKTNIMPVAGITFNSPDSVLVRGGYDLVCFGTVSGVFKAYRSVDAGATWSFIKSLSAPTAIKKRRNDTRLSGAPPRGQVFLADSDMYYSSYLGSNSLYVRNMPTTIAGFNSCY